MAEKLGGHAALTMPAGFVNATASVTPAPAPRRVPHYVTYGLVGPYRPRNRDTRNAFRITVFLLLLFLVPFIAGIVFGKGMY